MALAPQSRPRDALDPVVEQAARRAQLRAELRDWAAAVAFTLFAFVVCALAWRFGGP